MAITSVRRPGPRVLVLLGLGALALAIACALRVAAPGRGAGPARPSLVEPPRGGPHLALPGRPTLFKAVLGAATRERRVVWFFGDGHASAPVVVTDPRVVSASHAYAFARPGQRFLARLAVIEDGAVALADYPVEVVEPTTDHQATVAIDDGLWALHGSQARVDDPTLGPLGAWSSGVISEPHDVGITAMSTLAFLVNGYDLRPSRAGHAYEDTVERGLARCLAHLKAVDDPAPASRPGDAPRPAQRDGHRLTLDTYRAGYEVPMVALALVAAGDPERRVGPGNPAVEGRTYREVVVDLLETLALGQRARCDVGGWRYDLPPGLADADLSVSQWPALAFLAAEREWGLPIPPLVQARLQTYLAALQGEDGGFGYRSAGADVNPGLTAAGLIGLECAGVPEDDARCEAARRWLAERWGDPNNVGDDYSMYAVMKASKLARAGVEAYGDHDWRAEYTAALAARQRADGTFLEDERYGQGPLATSWPCLILAQDVFAYAEPAKESSLHDVAVGVAALVLGLALLALARRLA